MKKYDLCIIGNGFVGGAQAHVFSSISNIKVYDTKKSRSKNSLDEVHNCDFVFICVPSPTLKNGNQDLSFLNNCLIDFKKKPIYIIKSTVLWNNRKSNRK